MSSVDYGTVYQRIDLFLQTRDGLCNPKKSQDYVWFVRELTGIFCGAAFENDLSTKNVIEFLDIVQEHTITNIDVTGRLCNVENLISNEITSHPLYYITEYSLMNYKPGSVQAGPGEFFFCFYDSLSTFGIDNQESFDIITDSNTTELKKVDTNFTTPELFDKYAADENLERLLVIKPVSNAKKPQFRSMYACIHTTKWREAFYHKNDKRLTIKEAA